jgi:hypothetical protein
MFSELMSRNRHFYDNIRLYTDKIEPLVDCAVSFTVSHLDLIKN